MCTWFGSTYRGQWQIRHVAFPPGNLVGSVKSRLVKHPGRAPGFDKPWRFHLMLAGDDARLYPFVCPG